MTALSSHPTLSGIFDRESLLVQATDGASHSGYQDWHRALDSSVIEWLGNNAKATANDFLGFLKDAYSSPTMQQKFPNATDIIQMAIEELQ